MQAACRQAVSWGGGSAGGSVRILAGLLADAVGAARRRIDYVAFSGSGESPAAIESTPASHRRAPWIQAR